MLVQVDDKLPETDVAQLGKGFCEISIMVFEGFYGRFEIVLFDDGASEVVLPEAELTGTTL